MIDDKAYLFDARVGLEVPGPDGTGVATLEEALADPAILERMNLPGLLPYGTSRASLLGSPTKIGILIDSSQGYFSPKMKLLQRELCGQEPDDPLSRSSRTARSLRPGPGRPGWGCFALAAATRGRDAALHGRAVRAVDPVVSVPIPARFPPGLRAGQAAPWRAR